MIEVQNVKKQYGDKLAVDGLTFTVQTGIVTGFHGPNGSGKSTTLRMIAGLDEPTAGTIRVNGGDYRTAEAPMAELGILLEAKGVHSKRSARNHLIALAQTNGIGRARVDEVIDIVGLTGVARKRVGGFSLGMGQRLGVASALLGDPKVVLLQTTYDAIAARPQDIYTLLATIGYELSEPVVERLVQRGLLRRERKRFLGLFPTTSLPATNTGHESALRKQMSAVLEDGAHADARLSAVIATISASGTLVLLHPLPKWSDKVATRAKEFEQGNWVTVALNTAVTQTTASRSAAGAAAVGTTLS